MTGSMRTLAALSYQRELCACLVVQPLRPVAVRLRPAMQAHLKEQIALRPQTAYRGYQQLGANVTRYDGGFQRDWHEAIDLYKEEADMVSTHSYPCHMHLSIPLASPNDSLSPDASVHADSSTHANGCLSVKTCILSWFPSKLARF